MAHPSSPELAALKDGRYTLLRTLGRGSQAETYEARANEIVRKPAPGELVNEWQRYISRASRGQTPTSRGLVAIKCFHVGTAKAWKDVELAEREARTLASLDHPNLPKYVEHFEEAGALYLVMEMVEGESLAALRSRHHVSSVSEVTRMLQDIGDALRYLHSRAPSVVHRDIKPGNIIRRPDGSYALVDFGAVRDRLKPEGGSTVVGTFGYMAPEQFQGRASPRSDLYGLGVTALVMLTGCEPEDLPHVGLGIDVAKALPSSTPKPLARAIASMLVPDPDRRAPSVDDALAVLRAAPEEPKPVEPHREQRKRGAKRHEKREAKRAAKREAAEEKRRLRAAARGRRAPFVPRLVGKLALLVAMIVVWATLGVAIPLVLVVLSLVFGGPLRRAASSCGRAAKRARSSLQRRSAWLSGYRPGDEVPGDPLRIRVGAESERVRVTEGSDSPKEETNEDGLESDEPTLEADRRKVRARSS